MKQITLILLLLSAWSLQAQVTMEEISQTVQEYENILNLAQRGISVEEKIQRHFSSDEVYLPNDLGIFPSSAQLQLYDYLEGLGQTSASGRFDLDLLRFFPLSQSIGDQIEVIAYVVKTQELLPERLDTQVIAFQYPYRGAGNRLLIHGVYPYQDGDGDGLVDLIDQCLYSLPDAPVNPQGCTDKDGDQFFPDYPLKHPRYDEDDGKICIPNFKLCDKDGDGVHDDLDDCPNTKPGAKVNANGCTDNDGDGYFSDLPEKAPRLDLYDNDPCKPSSLDCDSDNDGVKDRDDECPGVKGDLPNGCKEKKKRTKTVKDNSDKAWKNYLESALAMTRSFPVKTGGDQDLSFDSQIGIMARLKYTLYIDQSNGTAFDFGLAYQYHALPYTHTGDDSEYRSTCVTQFNINKASLQIHGLQFQGTYTRSFGPTRWSVGIYYSYYLNILRKGELAYQNTCQANPFFEDRFNYSFHEGLPINQLGQIPFNGDVGGIIDVGLKIKFISIGAFYQLSAVNFFNNNYTFEPNNIVPILEFYPYEDLNLRINNIGVYIGYVW